MLFHKLYNLKRIGTNILLYQICQIVINRKVESRKEMAPLPLALSLLYIKSHDINGIYALLDWNLISTLFYNIKRKIPNRNCIQLSSNLLYITKEKDQTYLFLCITLGNCTLQNSLRQP